MVAIRHVFQVDAIVKVDQIGIAVLGASSGALRRRFVIEICVHDALFVQDSTIAAAIFYTLTFQLLRVLIFQVSLLGHKVLH